MTAPLLDLTDEAKLKIAQQAHWLMNTDLGRYLQARSEEERIDALTELGDVDPNNTEKIIELQVRKRVAEKALSWILEIVTEGDQIEEIRNSVDDNLEESEE